MAKQRMQGQLVKDKRIKVRYLRAAVDIRDDLSVLRVPHFDVALQTGADDLLAIGDQALHLLTVACHY